jgi:Tol biopolymer transport system component
VAVDSPTTRPGTGDILFYGKGADGLIGLYVMQPDGTGRHPVVPPHPTSTERWDLLFAKYSPDGSRIAIPHWDDAAGHLAIWITDPEGKEILDIVGPPEFWYWGDPAWSNDGTRLAIDRQRDTTDGSDPSKPIGIVDASTGKLLRETGPSLGSSGAPTEWSPDDTSVLLLHLDPNGVGSQLLDPFGGPARRLPWTTDTTPNFQRLAP